MRSLKLSALPLLAVAAILVAGAATPLSSAAFTAQEAVPGNSLTIDTLANYFQVTPGTSVQPGTSTPIAVGNVDAMALTFGTVPSARTFSSVATVKNVSAQTQTAVLSLAGVAQVASAAFASSGLTTVTLAPNASTAVTVITSATVAGRGTGTLRLRLSSLTWLYRDYSATVDEAPEAPTAVTATAKPAKQVNVAWLASTTTTNLAGYDLYRSSGAAFTKLNGSVLTGTTYSDTATVDGTAYTYKLHAVSSGSPTLDSLDSATATATADATPPAAPTAVAIANGLGTGNAYINATNKSSVSITVTLPAGALATDTVTVTLTNGAGTATGTVAGRVGAGTVTVVGIDASALADGTITISATSKDAAGNVSAAKTGTLTKDTVAPGAPTASYTDANGVAADSITGTAAVGATVRANRTLPSAAGPFSVVVPAGGSYTLPVSATNGSNSVPVAVTYLVVAIDPAGNTSSTTTLSFSDVK
ncbi:MAG: hypothetical protein ABI927_05480 [Gaiellaceae bacterium]